MPPTTDETTELLRRVPVFAELAPDALVEVAAAAVPRSFAAGEMVFREGDDGDTCYVVSSGRVRAVREHPDGRSITLAIFGPGEFFGELSLLDRERRSATVEAVEDADALAILGADLRRALRADGGLALGLLVALGRRLRETNERLARQSFQSVQSRVATALGQLIQDAPDAGDRDVEISITQAELARLSGSARESASRFLAQLVRDGVVEQRRGRVVVRDPERLERYVF